jgi:hypothetical protein
MKYMWIAGCVAALALAIGAQTAMAEAQTAQRTDPKAESPAGVIYQIPLDSARRDAAPVLRSGRRRDGAGSSGSGTGGPGGGSGQGGDSSGSGGSADAATAQGGGTPQNPSSIHSENGFGSASQVPGVSQAALRTGAGVPAAHAAGSTAPTYALIALIAAAAIGMGVFSTRRSRRREDGYPPRANG